MNIDATAPCGAASRTGVESVALAPLGADPDRMLTPREVCEYARMSERTLRNLIAAGEGPPRIALGRLRRFRAADVLSWLLSNYMNDRESA